MGTKDDQDAQARAAVKDLLPNEITTRLAVVLGPEIQVALTSALPTAVNEAVNSKLNATLTQSINAAIEAALPAIINPAVSRAVKDALELSLPSAVGPVVNAVVGNSVTNAVKSAVTPAVQSELSAVVPSTVSNTIAALRLNETYAAHDHRHAITDVPGLQLALGDKVSTTQLAAGLLLKADLQHSHTAEDVKDLGVGIERLLRSLLSDEFVYNEKLSTLGLRERELSLKDFEIGTISIISDTRDALVSYSIEATSGGAIYLEYSQDKGFKEAIEVSSLTIDTDNIGTLSGFIPAGSYRRLKHADKAEFAIRSGQEVLL